MAKSPSFQFYASDFIMATLAWKPEERGCYISLLAHQWINNFLPNDIEELAIICNAQIDQFLRIWNKKLKPKFEEIGGELKNKRLEEVRTGHNAFISKQTINGQKGGRPRKETHNENEINPEKTQTITQTLTQKNPLEDEEEEEEEKEIEVEEEKKEPEITLEPWPTFDDFWNLYDKKEDRTACLKKWQKLKQRERESIMEHLPGYKLSTPEKQYRKNPETYLNRRAWENEIILPSNSFDAFEQAHVNSSVMLQEYFKDE